MRLIPMIERRLLGVPTGPDSPPAVNKPRRRHSLERPAAVWTLQRRTAFIAMGLIFLATKGMLSAGVHIPWVSPIAGLLSVIAIPIFLLYMADVGRAPAGAERLATSLVLTLGLLMVTALAANTVLPIFGVTHPLSAVPAMDTAEAMCVILAAWAYRRHPVLYVFDIPRFEWRDAVVIGLSLLTVVMSVIGALRLNNGRSGTVTLLMLILMVGLLGLMLSWNKYLHPAVIPIALYGISLALLLMTSLRGWYTTGHDVQTESYVFQLTRDIGRWKISRFNNAYNACLSITILPMMIWRWTRVADPYVYKVIFQVFFALCPVLVYRLATRAGSAVHALLATIFFISFVTFFQDMPMLNRQEIAFLFLVCSLLAMFNERLSVRSRQVWFGVFAVGMVVSHYSTTYVAIVILIVAYGLRLAAIPVRALIEWMSPRIAARTGPVTSEPRGRSVIGVVTISLVAIASFTWGGSLTHTQQGLSQTLAASAKSLSLSAISGSKSSDTAYLIVASSKTSPEQRLAEYASATVADTSSLRDKGIFYSLPLVDHYPVTAAPNTVLPLSWLGRLVASTGINVSGVEINLRQAAARFLQILALIGLVVVLFGRRKLIRPPAEFYYLAIASLVVLVLQVLLPPLSVNYGLLRAFQQALIVVDVFLVAGALALVPRASRRTKTLVAGILALTFMATSVGVVTQLLGGYEPLLHLSNAGTYYQLYYTHPEEVAAVEWLNSVDTAPPGQRPGDVQMDQFTLLRMRNFSSLPLLAGIHPLLVRPGAYIFLGTTEVQDSLAADTINGDIVRYNYPTQFLDDNKDLLYSSDGARVYR